MTDLSLRERLARNMAGVLEGGWDAIPHDRKQQRRWTGPLGINTPSRTDFLASADLLMPEILSYLSDNGLAIVPVNATHPMLFEGDNKGATRTIWAAMVKAAPPAADLLAARKDDRDAQA